MSWKHVTMGIDGVVYKLFMLKNPMPKHFYLRQSTNINFQQPMFFGANLKDGKSYKFDES